jgi:hypothetical protein
MLLPLRFRAVRPARNVAAHVRQASTAVNPGMSKITNLDKSAGDPHAKVRDMSVFPKDKIRCVNLPRLVFRRKKLPGNLDTKSVRMDRNISIIAHIDASPSSPQAFELGIMS